MRDFFYNKGDILIAILVILVAAAVICFRIGVIAGYSENGEEGRRLFPSLSFGNPTDNADDNKAAEEDGGQDDTSAVSIAEGDESPSQTETPPLEASETEEPPVQEEEPVQEAEPPEQIVAKDITITINAGDAASTIADKLLAAGAITDKQAFLKEVVARKADSKLKQGTFTIPAGATIADIIGILVV